MQLKPYSEPGHPPVPVCKACLKGEHLDGIGYDHRKGLTDERGDCKNVEMMNGEPRQCCCGLGNYVYNHKTGMLETAHYKQECLPCKEDSKGNIYFEEECKKQGLEIPQGAKEALFCIDCGWAIPDGATIIE